MRNSILVLPVLPFKLKITVILADSNPWPVAVVQRQQQINDIFHAAILNTWTNERTIGSTEYRNHHVYYYPEWEKEEIQITYMYIVLPPPVLGTRNFLSHAGYSPYSNYYLLWSYSSLIFTHRGSIRLLALISSLIFIHKGTVRLLDRILLQSYFHSLGNREDTSSDLTRVLFSSIRELWG